MISLHLTNLLFFYEKDLCEFFAHNYDFLFLQNCEFRTFITYVYNYVFQFWVYILEFWMKFLLMNKKVIAWWAKKLQIQTKQASIENIYFKLPKYP